MPGWDPGRRALDETIGSDRLISLTRTDEGRRYFSLDGLRSVVNLTDDDGLEVASYHLDAWGNFRFPDELNGSANRFAFTGHIFDTETGLYNAKARYFDPKLGRFLTQDSYLGQIDEPPSLHRYLYANANPINFIDPTGHMSKRLQEHYARVEARMRAAGSDNERAKIWSEGFGATMAPTSQAASQVAEPVVQRLEGVAGLVLPGGGAYWRGRRGDVSEPRKFQQALLDQALDSNNSLGTRATAAIGAIAEQPGAVLNDIAYGLAGVPGQLGEAGSHLKRATRAESLLGGVSEVVQAVEKTAGAAETTISAILLIRGGAKIVEESRSASRAEVKPVTRPVNDYDPAWREYWAAHPEEMRSVGAAGAKEGRYEFPDQNAGGVPYVGQSVNIPRRLKTHEAAGRLEPGTETTTEVPGGKTAREIAEHKRIQELTGGEPASQSTKVSNKKDPIGPKRQHLLEEDPDKK